MFEVWYNVTLVRNNALLGQQCPGGSFEVFFVGREKYTLPVLPVLQDAELEILVFVLNLIFANNLIVYHRCSG